MQSFGVGTAFKLTGINETSQNADFHCSEYRPMTFPAYCCAKPVIRLCHGVQQPAACLTKTLVDQIFHMPMHTLAKKAVWHPKPILGMSKVVTRMLLRLLRFV